MLIARHLLATGFLGLIAAIVLLPLDAQSQQIYRIVGPDGRITYSDKAPVESEPKSRTAPLGASASAGGSDVAGLPFELRQVTSRYPVTLYTSSNCGPCGSGRALLASRGVPYSEKTVTTPEDLEAFKRLSGTTALPFLTIGGQQLKGYSDVEWAQYLDAAGYPQRSVLPANFKNAPASPLVAVAQAPAPEAAASARAPAPAPARAPAAPADNPAGIRF